MNIHMGVSENEGQLPISWQFSMANKIRHTKSIPISLLPGRLGHVAVAIAKWKFQSIDGLHKSWGINPSNPQGCDMFPTFYPSRRGPPNDSEIAFINKWICADEMAEYKPM